MCSVVGYIGNKNSSAFIFEGLARLEYRGYDAAGFACIENSSHSLLYTKVSGQLSHLIERVEKNPIDGFIGIGHTRWSTHGSLSENNAHPHVDCTNRIAVVHNGIIENYHSLHTELESKGHIFLSATDTEVIPHLLEDCIKQSSSLKEAIVLLTQRLEGMYALVIIIKDFSDCLIVIRKGSPICIGYGKDEKFIASDELAFAGMAESVLFIPHESFAFVYADRVELYDFAGTKKVAHYIPCATGAVAIDKAGYDHFMLKEIHEQPVAIEKTVTALSFLGSLLWQQLGLSLEDCASFERIVLIGCGTSWHAGLIASFFFKEVCHIPVDVLLASEFRYDSFFPHSQTLYIFISQSGETADVLEALRLVNSYNVKTIALTNVATSAIVREAKGFLLTHAGTEVAVASTKAFSTQLAALYWLSHMIARERLAESMIDIQKVEKDIIDAGHMLSDVIDRYFFDIESTIAPLYAHYEKAIFLGKHSSYPFAAESALKLKEIAYVFAQAYPAGELKHGPLALIDDSVIVYIFSHPDPVVYRKIVSSVQTVRSRGGKIIAFVYEDQDELLLLADTYFIIPTIKASLLGPLVMTGIMQFLMYSIAKVRGCPIDKPRNLAKSVTVE